MFEDFFRDTEPDIIDTPYEEMSRRPFYIAMGIMVGFTLLTLVCLAVYAIVILPRNRAARETEIAQIETQNAVSIQTLVAESVTATGTATTTVTPQPSITPTAVPTATGTVIATGTPPSTATVPPQASSTPTTATTFGIVLSDDFPGPGSGWVTAEEDNFEMTYSDGGYRLFVNIFNADIFSVRGQSNDDVRIEVDVAKRSGPEDGYYGVICRFIDGGNYYSLVIEGNGEYHIYRKSGGQTTDLGEPGVEAGYQSDEFHRLRGECVGDTLTLFLDDNLLISAVDDSIESGSIGLLAGTRDVPGLEILFDNFELAVP
jgi:hypothetical protein